MKDEQGTTIHAYIESMPGDETPNTDEQHTRGDGARCPKCKTWLTTSSDGERLALVASRRRGVKGVYVCESCAEREMAIEAGVLHGTLVGMDDLSVFGYVWSELSWLFPDDFNSRELGLMLYLHLKWMFSDVLVPRIDDILERESASVLEAQGAEPCFG